MKLFNTLTKKLEDFKPLADQPTIYSCGPTVYDRVHIGNLSSFITADILRRAIEANDLSVKHVMNLTDVDDKTIRRAQELYPKRPALEALQKVTSEYTDLFFEDSKAVGNNIDALTFVKATDAQTIDDMQQLITELYSQGFAYIANDGIYFSIEKYRASGKTYGQLSEITTENTSQARIQNDEYDKQSVHDFALWKIKKDNEPSWEFTLDDHNLDGRPGWHIECSVMSSMNLGQPFDIHTGGIDLVFPHHENEIAQSTAGKQDSTYAQTFVHNAHVLVDGHKMAKSAGNFLTLEDVTQKGYDPLAFRMLVLQSHHRSQTNFSWESLEAAKNRLNRWRNVAALRWQTHDTIQEDSQKSVSLLATPQSVIQALSDDLDTPEALRIIDEAFSKIENVPTKDIHRYALVNLCETIDAVLGLQIIDSTPDISDDYKRLILERNNARNNSDWKKADSIRKQLSKEGISLRDIGHGSVWEYTY